jgi:beta-apo-4'-carotenal oxygenase
MDGLLRVRYMPYAASDLKRFQRMSTKKANFDRNGNVTRGIAYWVSFVLGLGGKSATGALTRWGVVFAVAVSVMLKTK